MINMAWAVGAAAIAIAASGCSNAAPAVPAAPADPYRTEVENFRKAREAKLTSDTGWLTIAGLHFLTQAETTAGSDAANDVVLPGGTPSRVGTFVLAKNGQVSVKLAPGVAVSLLDGKPFTGGSLKSDGDGAPDRLVLGDVPVCDSRAR
jgi:uncharacterized protein